MYNHLVCICVEEISFRQFYDKGARWDWELTLKQFTVKGHYWVFLTYCDFNLYLVITRLMHKFKTIRWLQGHLSLLSFRGWMSDRNFWEKVNCLLIVALYSLEAVAPHPQKGDIKFMKFFYIYMYICIYIYIYIYIWPYNYEFTIVYNDWSSY